MYSNGCSLVVTLSYHVCPYTHRIKKIERTAIEKTETERALIAKIKTEIVANIETQAKMVDGTRVDIESRVETGKRKNHLIGVMTGGNGRVEVRESEKKKYHK